MSMITTLLSQHFCDPLPTARTVIPPFTPHFSYPDQTVLTVLMPATLNLPHKGAAMLFETDVADEVHGCGVVIVFVLLGGR